MRNLLIIAMLLIGIKANAQQTDAIVIVLDTSGSMGDYMRSAKKSRMEVAQDALVTVLKNVPETTKVGILTFSGWAYELDKIDQARLEKSIRSTRPSGGTPLYEYLRSGATTLLNERALQNDIGYYKIIVVTDGIAADDSLNRETTFSDGSTRPGVLSDIISRNLIVDAIALDMGQDHDLMRHNNGLDMKGDDAASLTKSLQKAVAEVGFSGQKDTSNDSFSEINDLPEEFVNAVINGLTTFRNHPIGEKPLIEVTQDDGTIQLQPDPANISIPTQPQESTSGFGLVIGLLCIMVFVIIAAFIVTSVGRY